MNNYIGYFATSLAGHDKGLTYVITGVDNEYVYVTDGRLRQVDAVSYTHLRAHET